MARAKSGKGAVEDASTFPFALGSVGPIPVRRGPDPLKPHYHEHRTRLRRRFSEGGETALADYELLELLLFRVIPRRDTKPLAKSLLARFGDLAGVLGADPNRIAEVEGAGRAHEHGVNDLELGSDRLARAEAARRPVIASWSQLLGYCRLAMAHAPREQFRVLFLDTKNQLIADEVLNEGTVDHAPVYPREVARRALEHSAASVILVHNHPSGDPAPSAADVAITREIVAAAAAVGVKVHDHLVIGRSGAASFKSQGLL